MKKDSNQNNLLILKIKLLLWLCITGCGHKHVAVKQTLPAITDSSRLYVRLQALDLTEDVSTVSSGNDEIVLLIYAADSLVPTATLLQTYMVRDNSHRDTTFSILSSQLKTPHKLFIWLLEMDSERSLAEIKSLVQKNHQSLLTAYRTGNSEQLRHWLADEDILSFQEIPVHGFCCEKEWHFTGIHLFDRYHYVLTLSHTHE